MPHRVTWRALYAMTRRPQLGSALYELAKREAGDKALWDINAHLLAHVIDEIRGLGYLYKVVHRKEGSLPPPPPERFPRPGLEGGAPEGEGSTHLGYGAIPANTFEHWWETGEELTAA